MESPFLNFAQSTKEDKAKEEKNSDASQKDDNIKEREKDSRQHEKNPPKHQKGEIIVEDILAHIVVIPPSNFAMVAKGVYRSGYPVPKNFPFLKKLGLKSILYCFSVLTNLTDIFVQNRIPKPILISWKSMVFIYLTLEFKETK